MMTKSTQWPVLKSYDRQHLSKIALPLGGIGTGTVSIGGRGDLRDWEIMNRPAKKYRAPKSFFAVWARPSGGSPSALALEGALEPEHFEGQNGSQMENHGLPRFRNCSFKTAYPFGQVLLSDPDFPLEATVRAFNPLVPCDAESSGIPAAIFSIVLNNRSSKQVTTSVCGNLNNFIGNDGHSGSPRGNINRFKRGKNVSGIFMSSRGVPKDAEQFGTMALTTTARSGITYRTAWSPNARWGGDKLDYWDDFSDDGKLENRKSKADAPQASLAVSTIVPPRGTREIVFMLTWHFPNRITWTPRKRKDGSLHPSSIIGNYYTSVYRDAWDAAERTAKQLKPLEKATSEFVGALIDSDLPGEVKEAALFNLSTLRSQTCFRTPDGRLYGWEGCCDGVGCCLGSCTHVWNYEQATAFLFGDLALTMRDVEFNHATAGNGLMSFRVFLPLKQAKKYGIAAADGQMGCIMKLYRDWQLSGDDDMLRKAWPKARKALEFCWIKGGWDGDRDGVMEGCQHNTMDVEYYGPNPQMQSWYLGALRAAEEMANYLGKTVFAQKCRALFERGSRWMDANLFNGHYYEHEVRPVSRKDQIAQGLLHSMGADKLKDPDFQLGSGCLTDQLVGQYMAHICGLGYLVDKRKVKKTLKSVLKFNGREEFYSLFNSMRSFALNDEKALLMASYPMGRRPKNPFPYFTEVMTGFEYTAAVGMIQEGMVKEGLRCIANIRDRYDGQKRSPFDEAECGHHYARAMASWAAIPALTGFRYSGVTKEMTFAPKKGTHFWSTGYAWGKCTITGSGNKMNAQLQVLGGRLRLARFSMGEKSVDLRSPKTLTAGKKTTLRV